MLALLLITFISANLFYNCNSSSLYFTTEPLDVYTYNSYNTVFTCQAVGATSYRWLKNGHLPTVNRWRPNGDTLLYTSVKTKDNGSTIICEASDSSTTIQSSAFLYVYNKADARPPVIINGPQNVVAKAGQDVSFNCSAYGVLGSIRWIFNGVEQVPIQSLRSITTMNEQIYNTSTLTIYSVNAEYNGVYVCEAFGTEKVNRGIDSRNATLTVLEAPYATHYPDEMMVLTEGESLHLECNFSGYPTPSVMWLDERGNIVNKGSVWELGHVEVALEGNYRCRGNNSLAETYSEVFRLIVHYAPKIYTSVQIPVLMTFTVGERLVLTCNTTGRPPPTISWYKDDTLLTTTSHLRLQSNHLTIDHLIQSDKGAYVCMVSNVVGNDSALISHVKINSPPLNPIGLDTIDIFHDRVTLTWLPTEQIFKYNIFILDLRGSTLYPNQSIPYSFLTTVNGSLQYRLEGLTPYTFYRVKIQAQNNFGKSGFSEFPLFATKTWYPSPPAISTRNITPFSVDIILDTDKNKLNGPFRGVKIVVSSLQNEDFSNTTTIATSTLFNLVYTQIHLQPFHNYAIAAFSYNGDYHSNQPSIANFTTSEFSPTSPPTNLQHNCTSPTSCTLTWEPPIHPNGVITAYTLTIENVNVTQSQVRSISVSNESYLAENLTPYSLYSWKILASTKIGPGPYIRYKFNTPQGVPSLSPNLVVLTVNSTAIKLTWPSLVRSDLNGEFHFYQIKYTFSGISNEDLSLTQITSENSLTLTNLTPYINYGFSIRVNAGTGYGPYSLVPIYRITESASPIARVENLIAVSHSPDSILLRWEQVPKSYIYAPTASYRIEMWTGTQWENIHELMYTFNRYLVNDLLPNTQYTFRIQLFNSKGSAPFSNEIKFTTLETIPGLPLLTGSFGDNPLQINLTITPTNSTTGDIIQFRVMVNLLGNVTIKTVPVFPTSIHGSTNFIYYADRYISLYKFRVVAMTSAGDGETASILIETGEAVPSRSPQGLLALPQSSTSMYLSWKGIPSDYLNGHLVGYRIRYQSILRTDWVYLNITQSEYEHVTNLEIFTIYTFQVAGVTIGAGPFSNSSSNRTLPDRPSVVKDMRVIRTEANLLEIDWDPPERPNGNISNYRVQVIEVDTRSFNIYLVVQNRITLKNLRTFTKYIIRIAATNQILTGEFSTDFDVITAEDTPSEPIFSLIIRRSSQLTVFWEPPYFPNGIILDYNLTCIRKQSGLATNNRTITVLHERDRHLYSATCKGLVPNQIYRIELFVRNSFDSNWNSILTQTDFSPAIVSNSSSAPQAVLGNLFKLPIFSETVGSISFYLVVAIIYDHMTIGVEDLVTNYSLTELQAFSPNFDVSKPYPYITANFTASEYGEFTMGDDKVYGGFRNVVIRNGFGYAFYVMAIVKSINANSYLATSSSLSQPIILTRETPSDNLIVIIAIVVSSTVFLCILICLLSILVCVFCARVRYKKRNNERNIPYKPCDMELTTVPWSANVNFKKIPKGSDPITYYRSVAVNDPQLDARPPVPAYMLPKILENLLENDELRLIEEYSHLTPIDTSTTNAANLEINMKKNRYLNILPYDHNRVTISKPDSDYINASFIDGADKKNAYIATQGPTETTLEDFWLMVYEQHIQCLIMITKLKEKGVEKCIQYWPTEGTNYFGKLRVALNSTAIYCDYIIRELTLSKINTKESRTIQHFQFISWPDHKVPSHALPMLNFIKRVHQSLQAKQISTQQPLLVHCSAGVGRTGTFIVLDSMMRRMLNEKEIDVFGHVSYLRTQRMFMVQGEDQYLFIFKVLAECYTSQKTNIPLADIENIYSALSMFIIPNTQITRLDSEFLNLKVEYEKDSFTTAIAEINQKKNRYFQLVPLEMSRVVLPILNEQIGSDYINASFIDGYTRKQQFIATQTPLDETILDFWRMIWHNNSSIIVMLVSACDKLETCYFPEKLQMYDKYQIEKISEHSNEDYLYQQFSMLNLNSGDARKISHFQYSSSPGENEYISPKALLLLCQEIGYMYRSLVPSGTGPITVHCTNGSGCTGMFIAVMNLLEEMKESDNVNIFQTVHYLRQQRPYMVEEVEEYQVIYEAILQQAKTQGLNVNKLRFSQAKNEITPPTSPVQMSTFAKTDAVASVNSWNSFQNRLSYTNTYRSSQISANSAFSNPDEVLEISY